MTLNQLISLMFDLKTFYSHELKCTNSVMMKTLGYKETSLLSSLLPGCDWSFVNLIHMYIVTSIHICSWSWLWSLSCCISTLYIRWLHLSWFSYLMDPQCIFSWPWSRQLCLTWIYSVCLTTILSCYFWVYISSPIGSFGTGMITVPSHHPLPLAQNWQRLFYKVFWPSDFSSDLTL